jgi:hypothetical protein
MKDQFLAYILSCGPMLYMPDLHSLRRELNYYLILGLISLSVAVVSTFTRVTWVRFGRVTCRATQPKEFWEDVVALYLIGVCFIGYFVYKVYGL